MKKYFPVLVSKKGELGALQFLEQKIKDETCPIVEVLNDALRKEKRDKKTKVFIEFVYPDTLEKSIINNWSFFGNKIILDFSLFKDITSNLDLIRNLLKNLYDNKINVALAIQSNSSLDYFKLVDESIKKYNWNICLRVSNDSGGFLNLKDSIPELISRFNVSPKDTSVLIDLGQVNKDSHATLASVAGFAIQTMGYKIQDLNNVIVTASSFPENLTNVPIADPEPYIIKRYEWSLWKILLQVEALSGIKYGDYGTKYAFFAEANFAGTVSLKYSTDEDYVIYRGKLSDGHLDGHGQFITHAKHLVKSKYYSGEQFSHGDSKLFEISLQSVSDDKRKTGNATNWVHYSQNHHITLMHSLL